MSDDRVSKVDSDEFYIGYTAEVPPLLGSWVRKVILSIAATSFVIAAILALNQVPFDRSYFEFGTVRSFVGLLDLDPVPHLLVTRPGQPPVSRETPLVSRYLIVAGGKHGAVEHLRELDGRMVRLEGTLIHREDQVMIELVAASVRPIEESSPTHGSASISRGRRTLRGEIVDSKCYFGVMKPGRGKPHRACASLCIRGGIPPVFVVDEDGALGYYLLIVEGGDHVILDMVGEPIEITGEVIETGDLRVLEATADAFERLAGT